MKITLITGNIDKEREYRSILGSIEVKNIDLPEIQEIDSIKIIRSKLDSAFNLLKSPVIVDDVSFVLNAISPLPGPFIKWFLPNGDLKIVCDIAKNFGNNEAKAVCTIGLFDGEKYEYFQGEVNGSISISPRGENGFGFDRIFIPEGYSMTWAEMSDDQKNSISHRGLAIKKLKEFFNFLI